MNNSSRIKLITEIAKRLAEEEWTYIDLTLTQFGLPWSDQWDRSKSDYVISMIQRASDQSLLDLASHLRIVITEGSGTAPLTSEDAMDVIREIEAHKALMIGVATGGPRIQQVNEEYKTRRTELLARLRAIGIVDPNPFPDLWSWYNKWSDGSLPSY